MTKVFKVIGLMSGTSLDGLDIAYCEFWQSDQGHWQYQIARATTIAYSSHEKETLKNLTKLSGLELTKADLWFGHFCGGAVVQFVADHHLQVDFVSSHGHTVFHKPAEGYTLQIGNGAALYASARIPVVCDFRVVDVALGGQGAPLVPIGDKLLFSDFDLCLNLGGIANISFDHNSKRIAFDICPVNIVFNALAEKLNPPRAYDAGGEQASKGKVVQELLVQLNALAYYDLPYPKSLGKEWIDEYVFPLLAEYEQHPLVDILCTFTHHVAQQIHKALLANVSANNDAKARLLVTGGGAYHHYLIETLRVLSADAVEIVLPDSKTIDFKEALIFAFLGVLRVQGQCNALASVTGASRDSVGGAVYGVG